jgi:methionine synthase II (cobalamin-independent)
MSKIKVVFKSDDTRYKRIEMEVETEKTVEKMILNYLEKIKRVNDMAKFKFLLRGIALEKLEILEKKIKNVKQIRPMCQIVVREVEAQIGGTKL